MESFVFLQTFFISKEICNFQLSRKKTRESRLLPIELFVICELFVLQSNVSWIGSFHFNASKIIQCLFQMKISRSTTKKFDQNYVHQNLNRTSHKKWHAHTYKWLFMYFRSVCFNASNFLAQFALWSYLFRN